MTTQPSNYADENLPEGAVVDGETLTRSFDDAFDVVIVGSGAAGAAAAHTLTAAGLSVGIVEEGPWMKTRELAKDVHTAFGRVMRQSGMQILQGAAYMPMLQGRCVGGSTTVKLVFDSNGKKITEQQSTAIQGYFTKDLVITGLSEGLYIIVLQTEKEKLSLKFVK